MSGRVIMVVGVSSVGKSSVVEQLQAKLEDPFLHVGLDHFFSMFPDDWKNSPPGVPSDGFWYDESVDAKGFTAATLRYGEAGATMLKGMRATINSLLAVGNDVIVDEMPMNSTIVPAWRAELVAEQSFWVHLTAPLDVLEERERTRIWGKKIGNSRGHFDVDVGTCWDLEVSTHDVSPSDVADQIIRASAF